MIIWIIVIAYCVIGALFADAAGFVDPTEIIFAMIFWPLYIYLIIWYYIKFFNK